MDISGLGLQYNSSGVPLHSRASIEGGMFPTIEDTLTAIRVTAFKWCTSTSTGTLSTALFKNNPWDDSRHADNAILP